MSGSARFQNSSDIVHDLKAFMAYNVIQIPAKSNNLFTDKNLLTYATVTLFSRFRDLPISLPLS